jgi:hypothetical protein
MAAAEELPVASNSANGVRIAFIYDLMAHDHADSASLSVVLARPSLLVVNHRPGIDECAQRVEKCFLLFSSNDTGRGNKAQRRLKRSAGGETDRHVLQLQPWRSREGASSPAAPRQEPLEVLPACGPGTCTLTRQRRRRRQRRSPCLSLAAAKSGSTHTLRLCRALWPGRRAPDPGTPHHRGG